MTVADQAAAGVHRNLDWRFGFFRTHLRQRGRAAFYELDAFARLGEPENFVRDNFCDGKTIVDVRTMEVARREVRHSESFLRGFARGRKRRRVLFVERQIIGGMAIAKQPDGFVFVAADLIQILFGNEHNRCRAIGDLRAIGNFQRRRHVRVLLRNL